MKSTKHHVTTATLTLLLGFGVAGTATAQSSQGPTLQMPGPPSGNQAELRQKMAELEKIRTQLDTIRDQALKDPALQKKQDALQAKVEAAMSEKDPEAMKKKEEFEKLQAQFESARASGDQAELSELMPRLQQLGQSLQATQQEVMQQEEIASAVDSFQTTMLKEMKKIDPKTESLLDRAQSIAQDLQSAMGR